MGEATELGSRGVLKVDRVERLIGSEVDLVERFKG
jgi:hypothetical protein